MDTAAAAAVVVVVVVVVVVSFSPVHIHISGLYLLRENCDVLSYRCMHCHVFFFVIQSIVACGDLLWLYILVIDDDWCVINTYPYMQ